MKLLAKLESSKQCSGGFCTSKEENSHWPLYVYSNVNDGVPTNSCHEHVRAIILGNVSNYLLGFGMALSLTVIVVGGYFLVFLFRIYSYCDKQAQKREQHRKSEQTRHQIGMQALPEVEVELE